MIFSRFLAGSWRSPASFLQGLATPVVRWEVSYEGKSFQKKMNFDPTQNFVKCPKLAREAPHDIQKIKNKWASKPKMRYKKSSMIVFLTLGETAAISLHRL